MLQSQLWQATVSREYCRPFWQISFGCFYPKKKIRTLLVRTQLQDLHYLFPSFSLFVIVFYFNKFGADLRWFDYELRLKNMWFLLSNQQFCFDFLYDLLLCKWVILQKKKRKKSDFFRTSLLFWCNFDNFLKVATWNSRRLNCNSN